VVYLGNLDVKRDWGFAGDYVEASFAEVGITIEWKGTGTDEVGIDADSGTVRVRIDPRYFRPAEVELLRVNIDDT
jgi:GDPmannose 4,6-dehydratase